MTVTFQLLTSDTSVPNSEAFYCVEPFRGDFQSSKLTKAITPLAYSSPPKAFVWQDLIIKRSRRNWIPFQLQWPYDDDLLNQQVSHAGRCAIRSDVLRQLYQAGHIKSLKDTSAALAYLGQNDADEVIEVTDIFRYVRNEKDACYQPQTQLFPEAVATSLSVIVNYRDRPDLMEPCLASLAKQTTTAALEILLVNNQSTPENHQRVKTLCKQLFPSDVKVIHLNYDAPFNHSAQTNLAVEASTGEVLIMLNNDAILLSSTTLQTLANWALTPNVASAGGQIIGKGERLVSSGIEIFPPDRKHEGGIRESTTVPLANTIRHTAGNTFACAAVARASWDKVGELNAATFPTQYNDAHFHIQALEQGLKHLYIGHIKVYHQPGQSEPRTREEGAKLLKKLRSMYPKLQQYASVSPTISKLTGPVLDRVINPRRSLHLFTTYRKLQKRFRKLLAS